MLIWFKRFSILVGLIFLSGTVFAEPHVPAGVMLPGVERPMKTAGYWISRQSDPDRILMNADQIQAFNHQTLQRQLINDIFHPEFPADRPWKSSLESSVKDIAAQKLYTVDHDVATAAFFEPIRMNMHLETSSAPEYGLVTVYASERILPTDQGLYETAGDVEFDQLQNSALDVGTPVLILHRSRDSRWVYEVNELTEGWLRADQVAVGDFKTVADYASAAEIAVVTSPKADLFHDESKSVFIDYARMGARFPLLSSSPSSMTVQIPTRDSSGRLTLSPGYADSEDLHAGYLPYNKRTILKQAFKMINQPYGWGGSFGEQDCSRFLQELFATAGIRLPRNSKDQAHAGVSAALFDNKTTDSEKRDVLLDVDSGIYILTLKGHIMLYLGHVDGQPYAIHAIYAYRQKESGNDVAHVINRVAVTNLDLGQNSKKGSLLRRLTGIQEITHE